MNLATIMVAIGGSVLFLRWIRWQSQQQLRQFQERFPPIDDEEFLRRCGPEVNRSIALRVRRIVSEQLSVEYERVYPEHRFVQDLGCD